MSGGAENGFIDNIIEKVCPAIDSCDECFDWLLNFADNRTQAVSVVNTVISALNEQNDDGLQGKNDLELIQFGDKGYDGPSLWEICDFFNYLLEDKINQGQILEDLKTFIEQTGETQNIPEIVRDLSINIIDCIAELEGIEPSTLSTTGNGLNQQIETEIPSFTTETIR